MPEPLIGKKVEVYKYPERVKVLFRHREVAEHPRLVGKRDAQSTLKEHRRPKRRQAYQGPSDEERQLLYLRREQNGLCPVYHQKITKLTGWHNHHIVRRVDGGGDRLSNRLLLHPECHSKVHSLGINVSKLRPVTGV